MDLQQILAMLVVAAAAFLVVRRLLAGKKSKGPACADCEFAEPSASSRPRDTAETLKDPAKNGTFHRGK